MYCYEHKNDIIVLPKKDIDKLFIELTRNCNMNCIHCCNFGMKYDYMVSLEKFKQIVEDAFEQRKVNEIILSGGEIFTIPHFFDMIIFLVNEFPTTPIKILTNGTILNAKLLKLIKSYNITLQVTLNGHNKEVDNKIRGNGFDKTTENLKILSKSIESNRLIVAVVINKLNMAFIEEIVKLIYSLGVKNIQFTFVFKVGRAKENWDIVGLTLRDKIQIIKKLNDVSNKYKGEVKIYTSGMKHFFAEIKKDGIKSFGCEELTEEFVIDTDSKGVYCYRIKNYLKCVGLDQIDYNRYLNMNEPLKIDNKISEKCKNCESLKGCLVGCLS